LQALPTLLAHQAWLDQYLDLKVRDEQLALLNLASQ
jgi:hypothetical protein